MEKNAKAISRVSLPLGSLRFFYLLSLSLSLVFIFPRFARSFPFVLCPSLPKFSFSLLPFFSFCSKSRVFIGGGGGGGYASVGFIPALASFLLQLPLLFILSLDLDIFLFFLFQSSAQQLLTRGHISFLKSMLLSWQLELSQWRLSPFAKFFQKRRVVGDIRSESRVATTSRCRFSRTAGISFMFA